MNIQKCKRCNIKGKQSEANREHLDPKKYKDKVDLSKSADNIYLVKSDNWLRDIDNAIADAGIKRLRKDSVYAISIVYDMSPEVMAKMSDEEKLNYFKDCVEYSRQKHGEVISAVIHVDESKWHMHVLTCPIIREEKANRLCAKDLIGGRTQLSHMQTDFAKKVGAKYGLERGICRLGDEPKKRLDELEYQVAQEEKKLAKLEKDIGSCLNRGAGLVRSIRDKEKHNAELDEELTLLTSEISEKREILNQQAIMIDDNANYLDEQEKRKQWLDTINEEKERSVAHNSEIIKKQRAECDEVCKVRSEQIDAIKQGDEVKQGLKAEIMTMQQQEADLSEKLTLLTSKLSEISGLYEKDFEQFINSNFFKTQMRDAKYQAFVDVMQDWKSTFLHPSNLREFNISRETFEKIIDMMITDVYAEEIAPLVENPVIETHERETSR